MEYTTDMSYVYLENLTDSDSYYLDNIVDCPSSAPRGSKIYLPVLYILLFLTGLLGNIFVIMVLRPKGRRGRSRLADLFVTNLAVADLVFVLTLPLWAISAGRGGRWDFGRLGNALCKLSSYVVAVNRFSNIFLLTCMSVDRYLAVVKLTQSRFLRGARCIWLTCAAVWATSLALGVPALVYRRVEWFDGVPSCLDDEESPLFLGLSLSTALLTFALPVFVLLLCYSTVLVRLRRHHRVGTANPHAKARCHRSLKIVLAIVALFVVSWLPFNLFKAAIIGSRLSHTNLGCSTRAWLWNGLVLSGGLAFLNSCVNPAIYCLLDNHFRRQVKSLFWQSPGSSASFANDGSASFGTTATRIRLQSVGQRA